MTACPTPRRAAVQAITAWCAVVLAGGLIAVAPRSTASTSVTAARPTALDRAAQPGTGPGATATTAIASDAPASPTNDVGSPGVDSSSSGPAVTVATASIGHPTLDAPTTTTTNVTVFVGGPSPIPIPLPTPPTVHRPDMSGRVVDSHGVPQANICVTIFAGGPPPTTASNALGYYQFDPLPPPDPFGFESWVPLATNCDPSEPVLRNADESVKHPPIVHDIVVYRLPALVGTIVDQNDHPLAFACVVNTNPDTQDSVASFLTNLDGSYVLENIESGYYDFEVRPTCASPAYGAPDLNHFGAGFNMLHRYTVHVDTSG